MTLPAGTKLGCYEIRAKLGEGGMGEVYLAEDTSALGRTVAFKIPPAEVGYPGTLMSKDATASRLRFQKESKA